MVAVGHKEMIRIREATRKDAETVSRIVCLCYEGFGQTDGFPGDVITELKKRRGSVECIRELITNEHVFVAADGSQIKGMVSIKDNEITKLFVDPHYHRQGIGKQLFTCAESFVREHGYRDMFLGAAVQTAVSFYERMGMTVTKRCKIDCGPCIGMTSIILGKTFDA